MSLDLDFGDIGGFDGRQGQHRGNKESFTHIHASTCVIDDVTMIAEIAMVISI
jgi:hypothetical protein